MAPKSWAITHPERSAVLLAPAFRGFAQLFRPVLRALNATSNLLVRACGVTPQGERAMAHAPADLALLLQESADVGTIATREVELFSRALRLAGADARSAMTTREHVDGIDASATVEEVEAASARSGRSRLLVHAGHLDAPLGIVHVRDTLVLHDAERDRLRAADLAYSVLEVGPDAALEDLLLEMRTARRQFAVVVEGGRLVGVVTMQDVLERLIGASGAVAP
jgi:CBS domain containing-hemolysin-like protein